jgi:mono/diheme cytochrome c family protein
MVVIKPAARCIATVLITGMAMGSGGVASADEADERNAGAAIATELCSGCHIVAEGQREPVPDGPPPFSTIASRPGRTMGYLQAYLTDPTPPMPHVPLSKRQIDSVIAYIRSFAD